jgi:hypothetical protein
MKIAVPEGLMSLTKRTARVQLGFEELMVRAVTPLDQLSLFTYLIIRNTCKR